MGKILETFDYYNYTNSDNSPMIEKWQWNNLTYKHVGPKYYDYEYEYTDNNNNNNIDDSYIDDLYIDYKLAKLHEQMVEIGNNPQIQTKLGHLYKNMFWNLIFECSYVYVYADDIKKIPDKIVNQVKHFWDN